MCMCVLVHVSPAHEVEAVRTHQDVAVGVHLQQVPEGRVKHQTSERETRREREGGRESGQLPRSQVVERNTLLS